MYSSNNNVHTSGKLAATFSAKSAKVLHFVCLTSKAFHSQKYVDFRCTCKVETKTNVTTKYHATA